MKFALDIMKLMNRISILVLAVPALLVSADISSVRHVYLLPMSRGLDQYLANRLTNEHVFVVVNDPKLADSVFTDRIGEPFQVQMENLLPPVVPEKPPKETTSKGKSAEDTRPPLSFTETANRLDNPAMNSSFGRGRGTVFLVDIKSRNVVWSVFEPPRSSSNRDLDRAASEIVEQLKRALGRKK